MIGRLVGDLIGVIVVKWNFGMTCRTLMSYYRNIRKNDVI